VGFCIVPGASGTPADPAPAEPTDQVAAPAHQPSNIAAMEQPQTPTDPPAAVSAAGGAVATAAEAAEPAEDAGRYITEAEVAALVGPPPPPPNNNELGAQVNEQLDEPAGDLLHAEAEAPLVAEEQAPVGMQIEGSPGHVESAAAAAPISAPSPPPPTNNELGAQVNEPAGDPLHAEAEAPLVAKEQAPVGMQIEGSTGHVASAAAGAPISAPPSNQELGTGGGEPHDADNSEGTQLVLTEQPRPVLTQVGLSGVSIEQAARWVSASKLYAGNVAALDFVRGLEVPDEAFVAASLAAVEKTRAGCPAADVCAALTGVCDQLRAPPLRGPDVAAVRARSDLPGRRRGQGRGHRLGGRRCSGGGRRP
jgi:hypothetical protein